MISSDPTAGLVAPDSLPSPDERVKRFPVIEEGLEVVKKLVNRGGVRVTKRVETREQWVDELLRSEHVEIERRAVDRPLSDDAIPGIRQEGDTIIVPVIEEVLVSVKQLVLVEEVRITRTRQSHRNPQKFTLRTEHIEVERLDVEEPPTDSFS